MEDKQSFIAEARREQIIKAAIEALGEIGYVSVSLSKIAKKASISTGLISYHFSGKEDLMNHTLMYLTQQEWSFISTKVEQKRTPVEKLIAFIEASLAYQVTNRMNNIALVEIVFNARTPDHVPYYLIEENEEDLLSDLLQEILREGQETGAFSDINPRVLATVIKGAISESMLSPNQIANVEENSEEMIRAMMRMVQG